MFIIGPDDISKWFKDQANCIKEKKYEDLDEDLLVEYLLNEGNKLYNSAYSHLIILISHMLKYKYQKHKQSRSWINTIRNQYREINTVLRKSKKGKTNLIKDINNIFDEIWQESLKEAINETHMNKEIFLKEKQWSFYYILEELKIEDFLLEHAYSDEAKRELDII